jgi:hypothetical protein
MYAGMTCWKALQTDTMPGQKQISSSMNKHEGLLRAAHHPGAAFLFSSNYSNASIYAF